MCAEGARAVASVSRRPRVGAPSMDAPLSILVVDDEPDIRETLAEALCDGGRRVATARDGNDALAKLDSLESPCVVLLDLMMPAMDGRATLKALRGETSTAGIPVVLMSAASDDARELTPLGAAGVIAKPFDPLTLPARLRSVLGIGR